MAAEDVGNLKVKVGMDSVSFNEGIATLSKKMQLLSQDFKLASGDLDKFKDAAEISRLKITKLTGQIEGQKKIIDQFKEAHQKAATEFGEGSKKALDYEVKLRKAEVTLQSMERQLVTSTAELKRQESAFTALGTKMTAISKSCNEFGTKMTGVGKSLSMSVTAPILTAGAASVKMASDYNESVNKVDVAFKGSAEGVKTWAGTTLQSFGIAKGTALDMAAKFGDMSTSMGMNTDQAAAMSTRMVGLAGDLASFKNISIDVANTALTGVFTGETESLKQLGIVMTQANLQEYALSQGIKTKIQDMTQAEQVQLRYNYILANTTNAQGDFARTSEGQANQMRIFGETLKELGANIGQYILPVITPLIAKLSEMAKKFGGLSPEMQKLILVIAGIAAAIGPLLVITGSLATALGAIAGAVGAASTAIAAAGGAMAILTGPVGLAVLAVAGLGVGVAALAHKLRQEVIPATELFGSETSDATKKAVLGYLDLDDKATKSLMSLNYSGERVSKETADALTKNFAEMGTQIKVGMDKDYDEDLKIMQDFLSKSGVATKEEQAAVLERMNTVNVDKKALVDAGEKQIKEILDLASKEKRELHEDEKIKIAEIQTNMKEKAVKTLSETELESKSILERMKAHAGETTAKQAAEVVKNSLEQKDKAVKNAEEQYNKTVQAIIKQRDETGSVTTEQADALIKEAGRQKDESVKKAEEMNNKVVEQAKLQAKDHVKEVDWTTGELKSRWKIMKEDAEETFENMKKGISEKVNGIKKSIMDGIGEAVTWIKELPGEALQWGEDIIMGIVKGIEDAAYAVGDAVEGVAQDIRRFLHFSVPDQGPLVDFESWMPDFMGGLAKGIEANKYRVTNAIKGLSADMTMSGLSRVAVAPTSATNQTTNVATNPTQTINYEGIFKGAVINVRSDNDIKLIAKELFGLQRDRARGQGVTA